MSGPEQWSADWTIPNESPGHHTRRLSFDGQRVILEESEHREDDDQPTGDYRRVVSLTQTEAALIAHLLKTWLRPDR